MRKVNYSRILYTIMSLLLLMFAGYISLSNIIPFKYLVVIFSVLFIWDLILYFTLVFKTRVGKNKKRKTVGIVISIFLIAIMAVVIYYLSSTMSFFKTFGDNRYKEENYLILVKKDSNYSKIEDLNNIGYVDQEIGNLHKALDIIQEKKSIEMKQYEQYPVLMKDVIDSKIESLIIEESYYEVINENVNYEEDLKVLDKISILTELDYSSKEVDVPTTPFTIYISGIDRYGNISGVSRSDVNIIATVNPKTKQILLVSIPRDYYVQLHGTKGYKDKLTHAGVYGIDMSISTIEDLLDVEINYYFRVNFSTLESVIDAIDGVDVYSRYSFVSTIYNYKFEKGYNHMNGMQALAFSRERYSMPHGDRDRGINQQAVLDGIVRKATSSAILTKYTAILNSLKGSFQTNMEETDIQKLIKMQLNDMATWNVTSYSLNGYDGYEYTYSYSGGRLYVMRPYEETIEEAKELIDKVYAGEVLESSYGGVSEVVTPKYIPSTEPETKDPEPIEQQEEIIEEPNEEIDEESVIPGLPSENEKTDETNTTEDNTKNNESLEDNNSNENTSSDENNNSNDSDSEKQNTEADNTEQNEEASNEDENSSN